MLSLDIWRVRMVIEFSKVWRIRRATSYTPDQHGSLEIMFRIASQNVESMEIMQRWSPHFSRSFRVQAQKVNFWGQVWRVRGRKIYYNNCPRVHVLGKVRRRVAETAFKNHHVIWYFVLDSFCMQVFFSGKQLCMAWLQVACFHSIRALVLFSE